MKITFLGTSHGIPAKDRFCTALMVESLGRIYLLDAGAPLTELFYSREIPYKAVKAIFISHAHSDHIGGLLNYLTRVNYRGNGTCVATYLPRPELLEMIPRWVEITELKAYDPSRIPLYLAKEGVVYEDDVLRVTYVKNEHIPYSYSILLEGEGKKILFTGDLSRELTDFPQIALEQPLDAIICELAHFGVEKIRPYLDQIRVGQCWFTHVNRTEEKFPAIRTLQGRYPYPIHIAEDNDEILL